jgi:hypothetical protein
MFVTVPGVDDVIATMIVHPPAGIVAPEAIVMVVDVTVTPVHVPVLPDDVVTPAGIGSLNAAVSACGVAFGLPSVSVSVDAPPETMVAGRIVLPRVAAAAVTVSGAEAGVVAPALVVSVPVVLVTVPGVVDVIATTIVQPPAGIDEPDAIVTSAGATVTPAQVPVLPEVVVTPAGIGSVKSAVSASGVAFGLPSVRVSVLVPPAVIGLGAIDLPSVAIAAVTVSGALAIGAVPTLVCNALVWFVTVPGVEDVIATTIVQPPAGIDAPDAIVIVVGVTVTPAHVPVLPEVVVTPDGIASVNAAVSASGKAFGLPSVIVSVAVPPAVIVPGTMVLPSAGPTAVTVSGACAGAPVPADVTSELVMLVAVPGVLDVIGTLIVQPPACNALPEAIVIVVAVDETLAQVVVAAPVIVTPAGIVSVNACDSVIGMALALPSVIESVAAPPAAMVAGRIALATVGASNSNVLVSDALADEPGPVFGGLVTVTVLVMLGVVRPALKLTGTV